MRKKQIDTILSVLEHFHEGSPAFGGWPIRVAKNAYDLKFIENEMSGAIKVDKSSRPGTTYLQLKDNPVFKPEHEVLLFRMWMEVYRNDLNKLYTGMQDLLEA